MRAQGGGTDEEPVVAPPVLSPWPSDAAAKAAAIARLKAAIGGRAGESDEEASALGQLASARVEREAPGGPQAVRDEAVIWFAGYFSQADYGTIRKEDIGPRVAEYVVNHANAWRNSGAAGLLAPWKIRRAGAI